jgi:hypothetical protein
MGKVVMIHRGGNPRISATVAIAFLIFMVESWVVSQSLLKTLEASHRQITRRITGRAAVYLLREGQWSYPSIGNATEEAGPASVNQYITRRRDGIVDSVTYRPLYTLCCNATISEWLMGSHPWWDQSSSCLFLFSVDLTIEWWSGRG